MASKTQKAPRPIRSKSKVKGFTVAAPPKNTELRRLLMEPEITFSGGCHTTHRRADRQ